MEEKRESLPDHQWPWQKPDDEPVFAPPPKPEVKHDHPAKPKAKHEPKHEAKHGHAAKHDHTPKVAKTAVTIQHVEDAFGVITVHGSVGDKHAQVKFQRDDLLAIEDPQARVQYVAGQIKAVADREHDPADVPNGLDLRGTHQI